MSGYLRQMRYDIADTADFNSVGLRAVYNAHVYAQNNIWRSDDSTQNFTQAPGSFVEASFSCGTRVIEDADPPPPVQ